MRPWELLREVGAATRAQRVPAAMVAALTAIMCAAAIGTVGRATRAEQEVRDRLESAGSRVAVLRDAKNAAVLPGLLVRQSSALDLVERAIGLTAPVDASTGALGGGGVPVAAWGMVGSPTEAVTLREGRLPQVGEALASEAAVRRLGLVQHVGWVLVGQREVSVVGVYAARAPFDVLSSGMVILEPDTTSLASLHVVARRADQAELMTRLVTGLAQPPTGDALTIESPATLSQVQRQVAGDLGSYSHGLLLLVMGVGALLITIVVLADVLVRRRDLGRRRALGASRTAIVAIVTMRALLAALFGASVGTGASMALAARGDVMPPLTFGVATAILAVLVATSAAIAPAAYAARRDPVSVLRTP